MPLPLPSRSRGWISLQPQLFKLYPGAPILCLYCHTSLLCGCLQLPQLQLHFLFSVLPSPLCLSLFSFQPLLLQLELSQPDCTGPRTAHCQSRLYVYSFTHEPVLGHLEGLQYSNYLGSSPPAVIARRLEYSTDNGVARCRSRSCIRILLCNGGRLSRPRHCSQCAARAQSCVSQ